MLIGNKLQYSLNCLSKEDCVNNLGSKPNVSLFLDL